MTHRRAITIATYGALVAIGAGTFLLPGTLTVPTISAAMTDTVRINGIVRDFKRAHVDFGVVPSGGKGHYAGTVAGTLDDRGRPAHVPLTYQLTNFTVENQVIVPGEDFAVQVAVLGAQIYSGSYHRAVTMKAQVGGVDFEPLGGFATPVDSNLNDDQSETGWANAGANPRTAALPSIFPAGTSVSVVGKSWQKIDSDDSGHDNSHWETKLEANTADNGDQVRVLVNGDPVPDIDGDYSQDSVAEFIKDYIDYDTETMTMGDHQAIFLYELANTSGGGDYQDLVVLLSLAKDPSYFTDGTIGGDGSYSGGFLVENQWTDAAGNPIAPHLYASAPQDACGVDITDTAGTAGVVDTGGIDSAESFSEWFRDKPGTNMSLAHSIELVDNGAGVFEYVTDAFHPIDGRLYGNEGESHNSHFTYTFDVKFVYNECTSQFVDFAGGDGAWAFIDGRLAVDLGGVGATERQRLNLDRFGLTDGEEYTMSFFFAQRDPYNGDFEFRTNLLFAQTDTPSLISSMFD